MKSSIKAIHSFPSNETKFEKYCELTFGEENFKNTYVDSLYDINGNIEEYDLVFVHYWTAEDTQFFYENDITIPKIWFTWGGDFYNQQGKFYNKIVLEKTRKLRDKLLSQSSSPGAKIKTFVKTKFPFLLDYRSSSRQKLNAINLFDYIVPVVPGDYKLLKKYYNIEPRFHHLNYINPLIAETNIPICNGKNILLGNSSSFTNNHIEAIEKLDQLDLQDKEVIIPLSYGREDLADYISTFAKARLENVTILRTFLPFEEYNEVIQSCGTVVMNHVRQQAVGNIVQALLQGVHVYLRAESPVYKYLKKNGIKISVFNKAKELVGLNKKNIQRNRKRTKELFGAKRQRQRLELLMNKVCPNGR